jgi:hypothetical protein
MAFEVRALGQAQFAEFEAKPLDAVGSRGRFT